MRCLAVIFMSKWRFKHYLNNINKGFFYFPHRELFGTNTKIDFLTDPVTN